MFGIVVCERCVWWGVGACDAHERHAAGLVRHMRVFVEETKKEHNTAGMSDACQ